MKSPCLLIRVFISAAHPDSFFDAVFSGVVLPSVLVHSNGVLAEIARILKPSGRLTLTEPTGSGK